jgi:hypothetical protein
MVPLAPRAVPNHPRPWFARDPTSIHSVAVTCGAHSPIPSSHLPRWRPGCYDNVDGISGRLSACCLFRYLAPEVVLLTSFLAASTTNQPTGHVRSCGVVGQAASARGLVASAPLTPCHIVANFRNSLLEIWIG